LGRQSLSDLGRVAAEMSDCSYRSVPSGVWLELKVA
jgi:hypothetical protein